MSSFIKLIVCATLIGVILDGIIRDDEDVSVTIPAKEDRAKMRHEHTQQIINEVLNRE